jgi:hypothetical protein
MNKTRRSLLAGSVLFIGILAVVGGITQQFYNEDWNHGGKPTDANHPNGKVNREFDPKYIMLLYMEVEDNDVSSALHVRAFRLQFLSEGYGEPTNNTLVANQRKIVDQINNLNATGTWIPSSDLIVKQGLRDFVFNQPHHFVIYIKNQHVKYNSNHPIWFGDTLLEPGPNGKPQEAEANRSFFGTQIKTMDGTNGTLVINPPYSNKIIYVKNFFRGWNILDGYYKIGNKMHPYSLNINAEIDVADSAGSVTNMQGHAYGTIPIIIDPDTGNMGGGSP